MANYDDALTAAQKRSLRTGRSFFPAANTYGSGSGNAGFGPSSGLLSPDQNPAYQAAIAKGRVNRNDLVTIQSPDGIGSIRVPRASAQRMAAAVPGSYIVPTGPLSPGQYTAAYNRGVGAPNPIFNPTTGTLTAGGVEKPTEQLTPGQRTLYGAPPQGFKETALRAIGQGNVGDLGVVNNQQYAQNLGFGLPNFGQQLGGFARNISRFFGGGNLPSVPATANAAQPSPTPYATPSPSPTPTPYKTTDTRSDLLRDTEGTFYGGGQAPIPTPTPTPYVPRLAYGQPRRYSDNFGYNSYA